MFFKLSASQGLMFHKSHPESKAGGSPSWHSGGPGGGARLHPLSSCWRVARTCLRQLQGPAVGSRVTVNSRHLLTRVRSCARGLGENLCPCPSLPAHHLMPGRGLLPWGSRGQTRVSWPHRHLPAAAGHLLPLPFSSSHPGPPPAATAPAVTLLQLPSLPAPCFSWSLR